MKKHRYIIRLVKARHRAMGWYVRLQYANVSRLFSDSKYGGKRKALAAALRYRAVALKKHHAPPGSVHRKDKRNNTGFVGISYLRYKKWSRYLDYLNGPYWLEGYRVTYIKDGRQRVHFVSIKKHGKINALRIARRLRKEGIEH